MNRQIVRLPITQALKAFADSNPQIARVAMWSMARDNGSGAEHGWKSLADSGITQTNYVFSSIFKPT